MARVPHPHEYVASLLGEVARQAVALNDVFQDQQENQAPRDFREWRWRVENAITSLELVLNPRTQGAPDLPSLRQAVVRLIAKMTLMLRDLEATTTEGENDADQTN